MTPEPDAPQKSTTARESGSLESPESQSLRVGNATLRVSKQSVGITLQTSTLLALLGIGWQAKNGYEEQMRQTEQTRIELERRYDDVSRSIEELNGKVRSIDELNGKVAAAAVTAQQLVQVQLELGVLRSTAATLERHVEDIERTVERQSRSGGSP